eukprot:TRINITY_DN3473_c0_g1_i1.p1 TRINITY_DN3473_c0_g1~~TRINITY_DN3473_c0_g1_i1.p1  ORF type:complete len:139 (-),score=36.70 TRINITY_DN3473_c0_g1_i1:164-580(-)
MKKEIHKQTKAFEKVHTDSFNLDFNTKQRHEHSIDLGKWKLQVKKDITNVEDQYSKLRVADEEKIRLIHGEKARIEELKQYISSLKEAINDLNRGKEFIGKELMKSTRYKDNQVYSFDQLMNLKRGFNCDVGKITQSS